MCTSTHQDQAKVILFRVSFTVNGYPAPREDGKTIHLRKATKADPQQSTLYNLLGISAQPGGNKKTLI